MPCGRWASLMGGTCNAWRRSRCGSLATLPGAAFRPPPLTPAPFAERLRSMASSSRHRSSVVAGRGPLAPGRRAPSCDAPCRSRLLGVGSTGALRVLGQSLAGHVALGGFGPSTPASPISSRGSFRIRPGAPEIDRARYRHGAGLLWFKCIS